MQESKEHSTKEKCVAYAPPPKWEEEFIKGYHLDLGNIELIKEIISFIRTQRSLAKQEVLDRAVELLKEKLLKKARVTDYADRTEYDEAAEIVCKTLLTLRNEITNSLNQK